MSILTTAALTILALALSGCVEAIVVMKNPKTSEVAQCRAGGGPTMFPIIQAAIDRSTAENCAAGYIGAGWTRMN